MEFLAPILSRLPHESRALLWAIVLTAALTALRYWFAYRAQVHEQDNDQEARMFASKDVAISSLITERDSARASLTDCEEKKRRALAFHLEAQAAYQMSIRSITAALSSDVVDQCTEHCPLHDRIRTVAVQEALELTRKLNERFFSEVDK